MGDFEKEVVGLDALEEEVVGLLEEEFLRLRRNSSPMGLLGSMVDVFLPTKAIGIFFKDIQWSWEK